MEFEEVGGGGKREGNRLISIQFTNFSLLIFSVNLVNDRKIDEYNNYLRIMEEEKNYEKLKEWQNWMREQPISVLKLDKTERLVLKIGGSFQLFFFSNFTIS